MKKLIFLKSIITLFTLIGSAVAKDITFIIKSKDVEINSATIRLFCDDKKPFKLWATKGHTGSKQRMSEEADLIVENIGNDNYKFTLQDELKFPNKHLFFTKCFASFKFQGAEVETGIPLESVSYPWISRKRNWTSVPSRKLSKLNEVISSNKLEICPNQRERVDRGLYFCQGTEFYNPKMR